ncbi:hypothetical protein FDECE_542 [Fusarium decemcellulare]|nr:hypothetical protein FDECE_542 [Fusarium decemcellulare]
MDAIRGLFGAKQHQGLIPKVDTDHVYPTSLLDDTKIYRDMILTWTFCFNDVLDPEKLHSSLTRLMEIGDWRKFGGRLRINDNGRLEIYVPQKFTPERPAVRYSHEVIDMNIDDHPLARTFPKATEKPSIHPGGQAFKEFALTEGDPTSGYDLMKGDIPQIALRIVSFSDATLLSLVWPHTLMDALGLQVLLQNWSLVLAGRESEVAPILGARKDVIYDAAEPPSKTEAIEVEPEEELHIAPKRVAGLSLVIFGLRFLWDLFWQGGIQTRTIFMPKEVMAKMRRRALEEIAATANPSDEKPFVSEGDVIAAWTTKMIAGSESRQLPVTILNAINLRYWMKYLMNTSGVYAQNLAAGTFTFLSPTMARGPVGPIALANRQHLLAQTTQPQLRAILRVLIADNQKGDATFLFGAPNMQLVIISNWTKAKIMQAADFGAAVIRQGETAATRKNGPGIMTHLAHSPVKQSMMTKNVMVVKGKDHEDNYWLEGSFLPQTWAIVEKEIAAFASEM